MKQNRSKTSVRDECTVGPTKSRSFNDTPEEDFAEASMLKFLWLYSTPYGRRASEDRTRAAATSPSR